MAQVVEGCVTDEDRAVEVKGECQGAAEQEDELASDAVGIEQRGDGLAQEEERPADDDDDPCGEHERIAERLAHAILLPRAEVLTDDRADRSGQAQQRHDGK